MMGGMTVKTLDEMGWSAIQEFDNWVAGSTASELSKQNCVIDVTPPAVNEGTSKFHSTKISPCQWIQQSEKFLSIDL